MTSAQLYGGKYKWSLTGNHRHKINDDYKQGVTTVLNRVLAKPALALWPMDMAIAYIRKAGEVTEEILVAASEAHRNRADAGASTGTEIHARVEAFLRDPDASIDINYAVTASQEARKALTGFVSWYETTLPIVHALERPVYSEQYDYCGIFDSILEIDGEIILCDLKTSNASRTAPHGIYPEHFLQMGAYYQAYMEEAEFDETLPKIDDLMVISAKKDGKVDTKRASELGLAPHECAWKFNDVMALDKVMSDLSERLGK